MAEFVGGVRHICSEANHARSPPKEAQVVAIRGSGPTNASGTHPAVPQKGPGAKPRRKREAQVVATRGSGPTNASGTHPAVPQKGPGAKPRRKREAQVVATRGSGPTNAPGTHPAVPQKGPGAKPRRKPAPLGLPRLPQIKMSHTRSLGSGSGGQAMGTTATPTHPNGAIMAEFVGKELGLAAASTHLPAACGAIRAAVAGRLFACAFALA